MLGRRLLTSATGAGSFTPSLMPDQGAALPGALSKYGGNPIVALGSSGSWEDVDIANPDVKWDPATAQWVMNYSGYDGSQWQTGIAYSDDLLSWTKEPTNPVLTPTGGEGYIAANGSIVALDGSYWLYYQGGTSTSRIYAATSSDLVSWTRANGGSAVIDLGSAGQWDDAGTFDPYARIMADGATIEVFYAASDGTNRAIGKATSTNGTTFTKQGQLFTKTSPELNAGFGEPGALGSDLHYGVFHDAEQYAGNRYINRQYTTNGTAFTREYAVLQHGTGGWDGAQVFDACPVWYGGTLYVFYAGSTGYGEAENLTAQIGVATVAWS